MLTAILVAGLLQALPGMFPYVPTHNAPENITNVSTWPSWEKDMAGDEEPTSSLDRKLVDFTVSGPLLSDPVYVDMVTGYVHEMKDLEKRFDNTTRFTAFPIWDAPIFVCERSTVSLK